MRKIIWKLVLRIIVLPIIIGAIKKGAVKKRVLLLLFFLPIIAIGQIPNPKPNTYINDYADIVTDEQEQVLNEAINQLEKKTTVQIAMMFVKDLPESTTIEDYALQIGRQWKVGNGNNGIVYVLAINQRTHRLEVAQKLQGTLTDLSSKRILSYVSGNYYKKKLYFDGLKALILEIEKQVLPDAEEQKANTTELKQKKVEAEDDYVIIWILVFFFIGAAIVVIFFIQQKKQIDREEKKILEESMRLKKSSVIDLQTKYKETTELLNKIRQNRTEKKEYNSGSSSPVFIPPSNTIKDNSEPYNAGSDSSSTSFGSSDFGSFGSSDSSSFDGGGSTDSF